jgi:hypothetical protein
MANLSLAIPQDSWCHVLSEVRRILAPEGRLELIDDQIIFPYDESPPQLSRVSPRSRQSASSFDSHSDDDLLGASTPTLVDEPAHSNRSHQTHLEPPSSLDTSAEWDTHAENSKGLEAIFEGMLMKKYGINPQPQDIIDVVLGHVFGRKHADQIKCMPLALAPVDPADAEIMTDAIQLANEWDDELIEVGEAQLREIQGIRTQPGSPERLGFPKLDTFNSKAADARDIHRTEGIGAKTVGRLKNYPTVKWKGKWTESVRGRRASMESLHSAIPESISSKAAERLGIAPANRRSWQNHHSRGFQGEIQHKALSGEWIHGESTIPPRVSMKAADRLAINSSCGAAQSPGLILWPSTFIPVEPLALEMHACKHMHVLLGCKAALSDFIHGIKSADGQAHISRDELNDLTWEYEW